MAQVVRTARHRSQTLTDLGDQLVDHYVSKAKQRGASWTEIGDASGVSKQAAQQRRASTPFDRFTDLNRHSIVLAQEAARTHKHDLIGTEHILLGLLGEPQGLAYEVLTATTTSEQSVRDAIEEVMPRARTKVSRGHIAFGSDSKEAIEQARHASEDLGYDWVGTEHMLLGLIRAEGSPAAQILRSLGFTSEGLHEKVKTATAGQLAARDQ
jgi:ATP-dependent Clp protease ATP-binding subunit ClpA